MKIDHDFSPTATDAPVFMHPDRKPLRFRPLKALHHFNELIKDKEDTEQVFHIFEALPRRNFLSEAKAFSESAEGIALRKSEPYLPDLLDDHERLRLMPKGSLAHAYCDFMEKEGLSAAGLVEEYDKFAPRKFGDLVEWYGNRQRDTHDLLHILTGYGRDALGEQCVLAFTYGQSPAFAHLFIAYAGAYNMKKTIKSDAPIFRAVREAQKSGRACPRVSDMNIEELLAMPLEIVRRKFNINTPEYYHAAHDQFRAVGVDPYDMLANAA